jgi:hypothetical protein
MNKSISRSLAGLTGLAMAAGAVYLFDPKQGKRRRAEISGQCKSAARRISDGTHHLGDEISSRYHGASTRVSSWFSSRARADAGLARRVRIDLWRAMKDSSGIGVIAHDGTVILHGEIPPHQHKQVLQVVSATEGVVGIADHLTDIGGAKSSAPRVRIQERFNRVRDSLMQEHWSPTARVCSGTVGLALLRWGATHRNFGGGIGALTGAVLLVRSTTNTPLKQLVRRGQRAVEEVPGVEPVVETIKRAGDELGSEWRQSAAAVS